MTTSFCVIFLSQVEVVLGVGLKALWPHKRFSPAASKALEVEVLIAKSVNYLPRSHRSPVTPAGQANSTGAATISPYKVFKFEPFAGTADICTFD